VIVRCHRMPAYSRGARTAFRRGRQGLRRHGAGRSARRRIRVAHRDPRYSSAPTSFITPAAMRRLGLTRRRSGG
jgi:hypothetical protein